MSTEIILTFAVTPVRLTLLIAGILYVLILDPVVLPRQGSRRRNQPATHIGNESILNRWSNP